MADLFNAALDDTVDVGATIIDPIEIPPEDLVSEANVDTRLGSNRELNDHLETLEDELETLSEIVSSEQYSLNHCWSMQDLKSVDVDGLDENIEHFSGISKWNDQRHIVLGSMNESTLDVIVYPVISSVLSIDSGRRECSSLSSA